jgi:PTH2 family peptidyl-tRNA hydrolase
MLCFVSNYLFQFKSLTYSITCKALMGLIKQVIVVRRDLDMGAGKIAAQVGHACVLGAEHVRRSKPEWYNEWIMAGQEKVVVKVSSLEQLDQVKKHAISLDLPWSEVTDAGHTQISPGTVTCISIGPAPEIMVDKVTKDLKLL